jgi:Rrf2 family protein
MVDIAINSGNTVTVKAVARRCGLSDKYLEQVTATLLKAGYLKSIRGPRGGYKLNQPAEEITAGMVLRAIEGNISPVDNKVDEEVDTNLVMNDVINGVWEALGNAIDQVLDNITIADLTQEYRDRIGYMYSI